MSPADYAILAGAAGIIVILAMLALSLVALWLSVQADLAECTADDCRTCRNASRVARGAP